MIQFTHQVDNNKLLTAWTKFSSSACNFTTQSELQILAQIAYTFLYDRLILKTLKLLAQALTFDNLHNDLRNVEGFRMTTGDNSDFVKTLLLM